MSLNFDAENRNANIPIRCCSFCRRPGHNITRCNSEHIHIFERNTLDFIYLIMPLQGHSYLQSLNHHLLNEALYDSNLVRAFAISRCGATTRTNMATCIELIVRYFIPIIQNTQTRNQETQQAETEAQPAEALPHEPELAEPVLRRTRRFGFSNFMVENYTQEMRRTIDSESESLLFAMMFMEIIRTMRQNQITSDRKFYIKIKISENLYNLEEKCECGICYEEPERINFIKLDCGHEFCKDCIKKSLQNERREIPCCAFCRADIKNFELKKETIKNEFDELITSEII